MIDLHCHILPDIDDGAADIYETLDMAKIAIDSGIHTIVATPHCNIPGDNHNYYDAKYTEAFDNAVSAINREKLNLTLLKGMEVFVTFDLPSLIKDGKIITLNNSRYLLVEFDFYEDPEFVEFMIERIVKLGLVPILAHPERYDFIKENPLFTTILKDKGCIFQANKGSFLGHFGSTTQTIAFDMLKQNLTSIISSDAHSSESRTPNMLKTRAVLDEICDTKALFEINPQKICLNQPL